MAFDQRKYYRDNREKLLEKQRLKYRNSAEYKAKAKASAAVAHSKLKVENPVPEPRAMVSRAIMPRVYVVDGKELTLFTLGFLARKVGKSIQTIDSWERKGILPSTPYRGRGGRRLYTAAMIEVVAEEVRSRGGARLPNKDGTFPIDVQIRWVKLGVPAQRVEVGAAVGGD